MTHLHTNYYKRNKHSALATRINISLLITYMQIQSVANGMRANPFNSFAEIVITS